MITKENVYKTAFANKSQRVKAVKIQYERMLSDVYLKEPRLEEIDQAMRETGSRIAVTALSGDREELKRLKAKSKALAAEKTLLLEKLNAPKFAFECDLCEDTGYVQGKICDCIKREASTVIINELSKEMPLGDCTFENFDLKYYSKEENENGVSPFKRASAVYNICREYAKSFSPDRSHNLLFFGETGLGKTHLTMAIVYEVAKKGYLPVYGSAENLCTMLDNERFAGEGRPYNNAALNCDLLVIDDLGTEFATNLTKTTLYNLINTRLLTKKPTIINTNLSIREIEERYTPRVASRLIGSYDAYKFLGRDIRQIKRLNQPV